MGSAADGVLDCKEASGRCALTDLRIVGTVTPKRGYAEGVRLLVAETDTVARVS